MVKSSELHLHFPTALIVHGACPGARALVQDQVHHFGGELLPDAPHLSCPLMPQPLHDRRIVQVGLRLAGDDASGKALAQRREFG